MALPVEYEHASNVIIFLNGLLLVVLIALSNWEKFRRFNSYSIAGDEGLRGEQTGLVDKGEAEAQEKNWTEVLHRNIENFVPFFLTTIFIRNISFLVLSSTSNQFNLTIYAFLAFQYVYLASRLAHMIGYFSPTLKFLRWTGFGVTAVINALLAMMAILITFIGDWKGHETNGDILGITCKGASIALFVLVIKIHSVLFATYKVKYYDENLLFAARLQNIARNDVEAFVPLCGFLLIFIGAIDMVILSSVPLLPTYNFNPFLITSLTLILAFTVFRLAHSIAYYRGLQPYRSLSYVLGLLALQVFGLVSYAIYTDYFVALSNSPLVADFSFGFKLLLGMFSLILLDVWRTAVVAALTGYNRMMVEKRAINIEDRPYLPQSDDAVDVDGRDIGLDGANMLTSEKLQSIHLNDLAFGVLFFYVLAQLISANLNEAESIGVLVIAALFAASRYVPFLASFGLRRHTSGSVASSLLSLVFVIVLLLWSFIEYEVFISKRQ